MTDPTGGGSSASERGASTAFLVLTFAFTWTAWLAPAALGARSDVGWLRLGGPVFLLGVFAPAIVALALTAYHEGRAGVARSLGRIRRWRIQSNMWNADAPEVR